MSGRVKAIVFDFIERAGWTAGQQFFAVLLAVPAVGTVVNLPWKLALVMSLGAALVSVLTTAGQYLAKLTDLTFWPDLGVRLLKTFIASMLGAFAADKVFNVFDFDWGHALDLALLATLTALGKGLLARQGTIQTSTADDPDKTELRTSPSTMPTAEYIRAIR